MGPRPSATPTTTITLWHAQTGAARSLIDALAADYAKANPSITLRVEPKGSEGDLLRQGLAAIALNQPPDLIIANPRTIAEIARHGPVVNLAPLMDDPSTGLRPEERDDFLPGSLTALQLPESPDQLVGFPFDAYGVMLYANLDLLSIGPVQGAPRSWEEFGQAAQSAVSGNARGWVMAPDATIFDAILQSRGGRILDETQSQVRLNQAAGDETLQLIAALDRGGAAYLVENQASARRDFVQGKAALWFGTTADLVDVSQVPFRWSIANLPQADPAHPATAFTGFQIALFRNADDSMRAAWLLTRWLTAPQQTARWSRATFSIPVRLSARALIGGEGSSETTLRMWVALGPTPPAGNWPPVVKQAAAIDQAVTDLWTEVANGTDAAAAMSRAVTRVNRALGQIP